MQYRGTVLWLAGRCDGPGILLVWPVMSAKCDWGERTPYPAMNCSNWTTITQESTTAGAWWVCAATWRNTKLALQCQLWGQPSPDVAWIRNLKSTAVPPHVFFIWCMHWKGSASAWESHTSRGTRHMENWKSAVWIMKFTHLNLLSDSISAWVRDEKELTWNMTHKQHIATCLWAFTRACMHKRILTCGEHHTNKSVKALTPTLLVLLIARCRKNGCVEKEMYS